MNNFTSLWINLTRAYEIALLGNFSLSIVFDREYPQGFEDYENIKTFFKGINFTGKGDLTVEICKPDYISSRSYETLEDITHRVDRAKEHFLPTDYGSEACNTLLKVAIERLNLSLNKIQKIEEVAGVIAQLGASKVIKVEHLAEAIQYFTHNENSFFNAENETLCFGNGISISNKELDPEDVKNAINYLTKLYFN